MGENDDKIIQNIKIFAIIIIGSIIGLFCLFFIGIAKVDAANAIGGYMGANDTNGVWWKESDLNYRCGWGGPSTACGTFDRALAILYNYQPSTSDTLTLAMTIYSQADYTSDKAWNNDIYILWGYGSNLYYNWSLRDSCTVDVSQTVTPINSLTNRKQFKIDISCSAKPPVSGAYPVIYDLQTFSNGTWGGLSNYVFEVAYVNGTLSKSGDNSDIINNQNQNTQQIMENDNKNTDKITDSVNENTDAINENTDAINDVNNNITDPSIDTSSFNGFQIDEIDTGLVGLISLPLTTIQGVLNQTCTALVIPIPFLDNNLVLPCLTPIYEENFNAILTLYQTVITAIIGYWVGIKIYAMVKGFTDPNDDKIEVLDL